MATKKKAEQKKQLEESDEEKIKKLEEKLKERFPQTIYLKSLEFIKEQNPLPAGYKITFNKPITVLVGDNGVGKSTITDAIGQHFGEKDDTYLKRDATSILKIDKLDTKFPYKFVDFHGGDKKFSSSFGDDISLQMFHMKASSGQVSLSLIQSANFKEFKDGLIVLDEPERGLSIRNQRALGKMLGQISFYKNCQLIMTCHSEIVLKALSEIGAEFFEVKERKIVTYDEFLKMQE